MNSVLQYVPHQQTRSNLIKHQTEYEVLIIRNTCINRLYDVVRVDYMNEHIDVVAQALEYEDAVGLVVELEETN